MLLNADPALSLDGSSTFMFEYSLLHKLFVAMMENSVAVTSGTIFGS